MTYLHQLHFFLKQLSAGQTALLISKNNFFWKMLLMKISHEICFCTLLSYLVVTTNVLQIKCYLFVHLKRSFNTFGRFVQQKRKSFHKIIKFFIFLKNGGYTVDMKSQAVNSDWTKKLTKKDKKLIFFSSESWDVAFFNSDVGWTLGWTPGRLFYFEITCQFCEKS